MMTAVPAILLATGLALVVTLVVRALFLGYPPAVLPRGSTLTRKYPPAVLPRGSTLTRKEQAFIGAAADALFPPGGPIPLSGTEAGLVAYMDVYLGRIPAASRALIRLLFVFTEHGPWLFGPRRRRFTRLAPDARRAALEAMATSPIYFRRVAFLSLRTMLSMGYLANDAVAQKIGMMPHTSPFAPVTAERPEASRPARALGSVPPSRLELA
jgi:hypothetical protein